MYCCCCFGCCCSECVGCASTNTQLCSSCMTGSLTPYCSYKSFVCTPTPGSGTDICTNTSTSCEPIDVSACLPYVGQDESGNEIYQNSDGSLTYSDGSPATRADIAYNCGACRGTPCSPMTCGTTDQPPRATRGSSSCKSSGSPLGGGSGGGSAKSSGGQARCTPANCQASKLTQAMSKLGSTITSLLSGGTAVAQKSIVAGQAVPKKNVAVSPNTYLLIIIVVGALLLWLAFGHKPVAD